jgi:hypothetical protein
MPGAEPVPVLRVTKLVVGGRTVLEPGGLTIRDADWRERLTLSFAGDVPELIMESDGSDVTTVAVHDWASQPFYPGPALTLADAQGDPVVAWHVEPNGTVNQLVGDERGHIRHYRLRDGSRITFGRYRSRGAGHQRRR